MPHSDLGSTWGALLTEWGSDFDTYADAFASEMAHALKQHARGKSQARKIRLQVKEREKLFFKEAQMQTIVRDEVVYDLEKLKSFGMGAFIGVTSGSDRPPKFIHLTYEGDKKNPDNNIWIIGKTITFDTGGISLKGPVGMSAMKGDMGGGAAVLSAFEVICQYKPKVNVNIICPATDNMPSGSAQKPGDVVVAMNGISIEVDNTDAEGRLTLADAISYAKKNNASMIIDIATLTGAARVSLGEGQSAIFSNNDSFLSMLIEFNMCRATFRKT